MRKTLIALSMAASAGACGQADEAALDKQFDSNFRASCVAAAVRGVASEAVATEVCDCTLAGINETFSTSEKMTLSAEQARPITDACMKKAGLGNG